MLKKLFAFVLGMVVCGNAFATFDLSGLADKLPEMKQGVAWSLVDHDINYLSTVEVATLRSLTLEAGYAGKADNTGDKVVAVLSYPIVKLKDLGVNLPILDLIELNVGGYVGVGRIQLEDTDGGNEFDAGLSATLINIKW